MKAINRLNQSNIIITGCTGFIGSSIIRYLYPTDVKIFGFKRNQSDEWRVEDLEQIELIDCDLSDLKQVVLLFRNIKPDFIFHCAAPKGFPSDFLEYSEKNQQSTKILMNLLEACRTSSIQKFVHCCSSLVYNKKLDRFEEGLPLEPSNWRGLIKVNEYNLIKFYINNYGLPINTVRILRAYGPFEQLDRLIYVVTRALLNNEPVQLTNKRHKRDYIFIDDLVELLILMATSEESGVTVNAGSGESYSAIEIANKISDILSIPMKVSDSEMVKPGDRGIVSCNISNARSYGWCPKTNIDDGLIKTVNWYVKNRLD